MLLLALGYPGVPVWWPHLKSLTVREIQPEEVTSLVDMVRNRKGFEHPLTKVCLDKRSGTLLQKKNLLEELQSMVSVELRHDDPEPWPAGLGYDDEDDGFWSPYVGAFTKSEIRRLTGLLSDPTQDDRSGDRQTDSTVSVTVPQPAFLTTLVTPGKYRCKLTYQRNTGRTVMANAID